MTELKKYKLTAFTGFVILIGILLYLIYNTFELKDRQYQIDVKEKLKQFYVKNISKENIYSGGFSLIDSYLIKNIRSLESEYLKSGSTNNKYTDSLLAVMFEELRVRNPIDSLLEKIRTRHKLNDKLEYLIVINSISLRFRDNKPIPLYDHLKKYPFLESNLQSAQGYIIGGKLKSPKQQNTVTSVSMGPAVPYSYDINVTFFADSNDRQSQIFKSALPVLLLTLFALLLVVFVYYFTFKSWSKQKKISDMKSDFINSITHEFSTPISTIMVANRAIQNEKVFKSKESVTEFTEIIARQTKQLQTLFDQVMDITRVNTEIEKNEVIFCQLLTEVIQDYRIKMNDKNVYFHTQGINNETRVSLNRFWVTTMISNIFDNAIKYSDKTPKEIQIIVDGTPNGLRISIRDNGIGMEEHTIKHLFDKFYRGKNLGREHVSGLGLGMYYVQQCIKIHNWTMQVQSTIGLGSEILIII
ncbi:two-component system phosphate regulon sensor histidine kinase PhoR [Pedobacter sp. W3I1]|uniref:sensor histidine kinase n=1 Tax=Pedobacter sp. W3I1 TaxID=3042291 RepID=UPI00278BA21E|nr:HAMP domain-containing sensor histidine kinase [Pedobacter sp. W3I1]MDQ0641118.1 two-component system phosphate regulon sensor histidine kinase PhoR [Pedobacter sp. W3I1]